jgi:hypothetical protein
VAVKFISIRRSNGQTTAGYAPSSLILANHYLPLNEALALKLYEN